jgi:hypothetical protein
MAGDATSIACGTRGRQSRATASIIGVVIAPAQRAL